MSRRTSIRPEIRIEPTAEKYRIEATLRFVTPLFGGGVKLEPSPNEHIKHDDPITPVRGSALGGALRAWWRRIHGRGLDLAALRGREGRLWGGSNQKGLVRLAVDGRALKTEQRTFYTLVSKADGKPRPRAEDPALAYAAFPLQGSEKATDTGARTLPMLTGTFAVRLELDTSRVGGEEAPVLWAEVLDTWHAFVAFGGLGGRTRRGFGAIEVLEGEGKDPDPVAIAEMHGWRLAIRKPADDAHDAWKQAIARLQNFRQGPEVGRNLGSAPNRPGRSRWPEPDQIRRLTGRASADHRTPTVQVPAFPRAVFGMPIIFHFKDPGDPPDTQLLPRGKDRMASPLILRPIKVSGAWCAGALLLHRCEDLDEVLGDLELKGATTHPSPTGLLSSDQQQQVQPLREHRARASTGTAAVLDPFFSFFDKRTKP